MGLQFTRPQLAEILKEHGFNRVEAYGVMRFLELFGLATRGEKIASKRGRPCETFELHETVQLALLNKSTPQLMGTSSEGPPI